MGFVPPLNLGGFQPSPATLAQWMYQIWQYLQENPIATQEQLQEYIGTFITTSPETQAMIGAGVEEYLTDNPPTAPVQSVQGKTGAVVLSYPDIVPASNAVPVYRAATAPNTNTAQGLYNNGYRLFVNTATQEIFTISPAGALSLVGRGKFDGTTVDLNSAQGDTTISEAIAEQSRINNTQNSNITTLQGNITNINSSLTSATVPVQRSYNIMSGYSDRDDVYNYVATIGKLCVFHINVIATETRAPGDQEFVIKGLPQSAHGQMFFGFVSDGSTVAKPARMTVISDGQGGCGIRFHYPTGVTLTNRQAIVMAGSYITA